MNHPAPAAWFFLVPVLVPFWMGFVLWTLSKASGWTRLAGQFGVAKLPEDSRLKKRQSGKVGWVNFNNCLNVAIAEHGIGLSISWPFGFFFRPILLPWSELSEPIAKRVFWVDYAEFSVGRPPIAKITLRKKLFADGAHKAI